MDEERALEWHRVDRSPRKVLVAAVALVMLGATGIGAAFVSRLGDGASHAIALGSACVMFVGVFTAVGAAWATMSEDTYLAIRRDAVVLHWSREREVIVKWDDVGAIAATPDDREVTLESSDGAVHRWSVRSGAAELVRRLADAKKKAAHGLLG